MPAEKRAPSLRKHTAMYMLTILLLIVICAGMYIVLYTSVINSQVEDTFSTSVENAQKELNDTLALFDQTASSLSYSAQMQTMLFTRYAEEYFRVSDSTLQILDQIEKTVPFIDRVFYMTSTGRCLYTESSARAICKPCVKETWDSVMRGDKVLYKTVTHEGMVYLVYMRRIQNTGVTRSQGTAVCAIATKLEKLTAYILDEQYLDGVAVISSDVDRSYGQNPKRT